MKKGFTLIELLACIGLMAMLATVIITASVKKINETKEKSRELLIQSIELSAVEFVIENLDSLSNLKQYDWENIELQTLVESNKLTSNLLDQTTGKNLPLSDVVYVTRSYNNKISAKYDINQKTKPSIILNGSYNIYLDNGETYTESGVIATSINGENVTNSVVYTGTINTSLNGVYVKTYNVNGKEITRNIIVGENNY